MTGRDYLKIHGSGVLRSKKGALGSFLNCIESEIKPLGLLLLLQQALRMQLGHKQRYLQGSYDRFLQKSF